VPAKNAVVQAGGGHVRDAGEADGEEFVDQPADVTVGVRCADPADHGRVLDDRQEPLPELQGERVRVAVGEIAGERAVAVHSEGAGVVRHQDVDAGAVGRLRDQPDSRAADHDRLRAGSHVYEPLEDLGPRELPHRGLL